MPQTLGPKIPFYAPLRPSKKAAADGDGATNDQLWARILCKDSIGLFLGLIPAPYRYSRFDSLNPNAPSGNQGRRFMINDKVGAKPFKLRLAAGTVVRIDGQRQGAEPEPQVTTIPVKELSLYVPEHITVFDIIWWINNDTGTYVRINGTETNPLDGYVPGGGVTKVIAVTTPAERKYNLRTDLVREARPITNVLFTGAPIPPP